ncbi:MAG: ComEC/Rec2 family competence protein [Lachnospiraceae bacterium]|nr:ComEC/Rec2 family competence protein [Lachnospiraceae bacterium]
MRRPFVVICLLFLLALRLYFCVFVPGYGQLADAGQFVYVSGRVSDMEVRESDSYVRYLVTLSDVSLKDGVDGAASEDWSEIVCYFTDNPGLRAGERVWVSGTLRYYSQAQNPGQFDLYRYYYVKGRPGYLTAPALLWRDGDSHPLRELAARARTFLKERLALFFGEKYMGVMQAMLLGGKTELDDDVRELFSGSGILHILTISGLHISMLGMGCFQLLRRAGVPLKASAVCGGLLILLYGSLIGLAAATVRAICMFLLQMLAVFWGRIYDMRTGMAVSAVLLLMEQPLYLFYSGFLYSYGAVAGMAFVVPLLKRLAEGRGRWMEQGMKVFGAGLGVLIMTLPIQIYYYYTWAPYSLLLNVMILPLMPLLIGLGLGVLCCPIGGMARWAVWGCERILDLFFALCGFAVRLPGHSLITGRPDLWRIYVYYGLMGLFCLLCAAQAENGWMKQQLSMRICETKGYLLPQNAVNKRLRSMWIREKKGGPLPQSAVKKKLLSMRTREKNGRPLPQSAAKKLSVLWEKAVHFNWNIILPVISVFTVCAAVGILTFRTSPDFLAAYLSVGQGDCMVLQAGGQVYITDCGSSSLSAVAEDILLPYLKYCGISEVDGVFLSHADSDHVNGIVQWLEDYGDSGVAINMIILPEAEAAYEGGGFDELLSLAAAQGISLATVSAGQTLELQDVKVSVLAPAAEAIGDENDLSMVLLWEYSGRRLLSTGDISAEVEESLIEEYEILSEEPLLILKAAHHGSRYSSGEIFLEALRPQYTVLSYGENNSYGHPHADTLERLAAVGTEIYHTALQGAVEVRVDAEGEAVIKCFLVDQSAA